MWVDVCIIIITYTFNLQNELSFFVSFYINEVLLTELGFLLARFMILSNNLVYKMCTDAFMFSSFVLVR